MAQAAAAPAPVPIPRSVARHSPAELVPVAIAGDIVTLAAASASRPGAWNHTAYDLTTGTAHCECKAAQCGRPCWHLALLADRARALVAAWGEGRFLTDRELAQRGMVLAGYVRLYTVRVGRPLPRDEERLTMARWEWRRRAAHAAPVPLTLTGAKELPAAA